MPGGELRLRVGRRLQCAAPGCHTPVVTPARATAIAFVAGVGCGVGGSSTQPGTLYPDRAFARGAESVRLTGEANAENVRWSIEGWTLPGSSWRNNWDTVAWPDGPWELSASSAGREPVTRTYRVDNHHLGVGFAKLFVDGDGAASCGLIEARFIVREPGPTWFWLDGAPLSTSAQNPGSAPLAAPATKSRLRAVTLLADGRSVSDAVWIEPAAEGCVRPPQVSILAPSSGGLVGRNAMFQVAVSADRWVVGYELSVGGALLWSGTGLEQGLPMETFSLTEGTQRVDVTAIDAEGGRSSSGTWLTYDGTPPTVAIESPGSGDPVGDSVAVSYRIDDPEATVTLVVDGAVVQSLPPSSSAATLNLAGWGAGTHSVEVFAEDAVGNRGNAAVDVVYSPDAALVFQQPAPDLRQAGQFEVVVDAADGGDLTQAELRFGGVPQGVRTERPWTWTVDACLVNPARPVLDVTATSSTGQEVGARLTVLLDRETVVLPVSTSLVSNAELVAWVQHAGPVVSASWQRVDDGVSGELFRVERDRWSGSCSAACPADCSQWAAVPDLAGVPEGWVGLDLHAAFADGSSATERVYVNWDPDADDDGFLGIEAGGDDADDDDDTVYPGAPESCDGKDNDGDGTVDGLSDADGDGYWTGTDCPPELDDCDDADNTVFPGAADACDGRDENCDGLVDNSPLSAPIDETFGSARWDVEGEWEFTGNEYRLQPDAVLRRFSVYVDPNGVTEVEFRVYQWVYDAAADDSTIELVYAGPMTLSGTAGWYESDDIDLDNRNTGSNLDGQGEAQTLHLLLGITRDLPIADYFSEDGGGDRAYVRSEGGAGFAFTDTAELAYTAPSSSVYFAQRLTLDTFARIDVDHDGDGYTWWCGECQDADPAVFPGAPEVCNLRDENCDGVADETFDADGDGWGDCYDCDDSVPEVNPGELEVCDDAIDDDCSGWAERCRSVGTFAASESAADVEGDAGALLLGNVLALADDLDGDGYGELLLGASEADSAGSGSGSAWLLPGSASGPTPLASAMYRWDGSSTYDAFGSSITTGDFDADGLVDLLCGASGSDSGASGGGAVYLFSGADFSGASTTDPPWITGDEAGMALGGVLTAGSFGGAGDGVAVGLPSADGAVPGSGAVLVWADGTVADGVAGDAEVNIGGRWEGSQLGTALSLGDFDGDGALDLVAGAPGDGDGSGELNHAAVFEDVAGWNSLARTPDCAISGEVDEHAGTSVAVLDFDGDGRDNVAVGLPQAAGGGADAGSVALISNLSGGCGDASSADVYLSGGAGDEAGSALSSAGDVDNDGADDLLVGAPGRDGDAGAVVLVYGGGRGGSYTLGAGALTYEGSGDDRLGSAVAGGVDLNADGFPDLVVGAPGANGGGWSAGGVYLYTELP